MSRQGLIRGAVVVAAVTAAFAAHLLGTGRPVRSGMRVGEVSAAPVIQIGLSRALRDPSARIRVAGPVEVRGARGVLSRLDALDWTVVAAAPGGIRLGESEHRENPLTLVPEGPAGFEVEYGRDLRGAPVKPAAVRYLGRLLIHAQPDGKLVLVNEVDLEDYLKGLVGKEMNLGEEVEALKAQVIAARTYAVHEQRLERVRRIKGEKFDLYDDERSQVYGGLERATALAARLVDETRGMFLTWEGRLVRAFYSAACGGHTEPAWEVLQDETDRIPPLAGTSCGFCQRRAIYKWKDPVVIPKKEFAEKCLPKEFQSAKVARIEITKTLPGGHAQELTVSFEHSSKTVRLHANQEFRRVLSARFRSLLWDHIEDKGEALAVYGRGFGHGAGMCQTGAYEQARDGRSAAEILEYYFPTARVKKLY
jgi:stage II sporulation protein D